MLKRYLLSPQWLEESRFIGAMLTADDRHDAYWHTLTDLLNAPDRAGEVQRRIAGILAAGGISDGGIQLLGRDLRAQLWDSVNLGNPLVDEDLRSLLELDPEYLLQRVIAGELREERILEIVYRSIPVRLRKSGLDESLAKKPVWSWLIGLPGRSFSPHVTLRDLTGTALDANAPVDQRVEAIKELGARRASECAEPLIPLLDNQEEEISSTAAETLGKIGGRKAAVAMAERLVSPQQNFLGLFSTLLNALSIHGYGILEPYSRDMLVEGIANCEEESHLEILLDAVAGTAIPNPPHRILKILRGVRRYSSRTRQAAAEVFAGITDEAFLTEALAQLVVEKNTKIRRSLLRAVPFVPVAYEGIKNIWAYFESPARGGAEKALALLLFCRTLRRFPNHSLGLLVYPYLRTQLMALATGVRTEIERHVIKNAHLIPQSEELKKVLISIVCDERLSGTAREEAASELARFELTNAEIDELQKQFDQIFKSSESDPALSVSLAKTLVAAQPKRSLDLLRELETVESNPSRAIRSAILKLTQQSGYLLFDSDVIGPDGFAVR